MAGRSEPPTATFRQAYDALYNPKYAQPGYRRDLLPDPADYYAKRLNLYKRGNWVSACCSFHPDKRPSLSVNLVHGGFKCHGCVASGGDVLAFHMRLTGMRFVDAAKALGAWRDGAAETAAHS